MPPTSAFELYRGVLFEPAHREGSVWVKTTGAARQVVSGIADLVYPAHCMACGASLPGTAAMCEACACKVQWIGHDSCRRCGAGVGLNRGVVEGCPECAGRPPAYIESSCAVAKYGDPLRAVILGLKFGGGLQAIPLLARLLTVRLNVTKLLADQRDWAVVPVPLARADFQNRGFNQAAELSAQLAKTFDLRLECALLRKSRSTKPQATLGHTERAGNLSGVFTCDTKRAQRYQETGVLLVDDVMTTGATLSECARTLHAAGVKRMRAAVVARG